MKLFDKFKDLFVEYEEVDEKPKEEIKKEVIKVEIPNPEDEEKVEVLETESLKPEILKSIELKEEVLNTPIFFDDKDFLSIEKGLKENEDKILSVSAPYPSKDKEETDKKLFRPTPIISPVYGILDKNYTKDEIKPKDELKKSKVSLADDDIDSIRKKAYGTLEDDLENTLISRLELHKNKTEEIEDDKEEEREDNLIEEEISDSTYDKEDDKEVNDDTLDMGESDLFNLIDTMYDKGDEE